MSVSILIKLVQRWRQGGSVLPGQIGGQTTYALAGHEALISGHRSAWAQYSILSDQRDRIAAALKAEGIPTAIYYPIPMHLQAAYRAYGAGAGSCPVAERLATRILSLPMHPYLEDAAIVRISDIVRRAA